MTRFWQELHRRYDEFEWTKKPSLFAEDVREYLPHEGLLLDLGAGQGQDSIYFAELGFDVVSTDIEPSALERGQVKADDRKLSNVTFKQLDLAENLQFEDNSFDVVYSHLALHYFDTATTQNIMSEIHRVLKPAGLVMFLVNSVNDPEYNTGRKIEDSYFETEGTEKRFFSVADAQFFTIQFEKILCDEKGETYKDKAKGVHNLIRYVGRKG